MKNIPLKLFIVLLIAFVSVCVVSQAVVKRVVLSKTSFQLNKSGETFSVEKYKSNNEVGIVVTTKDGRKVLDLDYMGAEEKLFTLVDKPKSIAIKDLTGDGIPEVIATAYYGPASALYVFKYNEKMKKFAPMKFIDSKDAEMNRDFMVSDMPQANGLDMTILANNQLRSLGKIYPTKLGGKTKAGYYYFEARKDNFKLIKTEVLK